MLGESKAWGAHGRMRKQAFAGDGQDRRQRGRREQHAKQAWRYTRHACSLDLVERKVA